MPGLYLTMTFEIRITCGVICHEWARDIQAYDEHTVSPAVVRISFLRDVFQLLAMCYSLAFLGMGGVY